MNRISLLSLLVVGAVAAAPADAEPPAADASGRLVEYRFDFGQDVPFRSYRVVFRLHNDMPPAAPVTIAPVGRMVLNGIEINGCLQSRISGFANQYQSERMHAGPGVTFTQWGAGHPAAVRRAKGGLQESGSAPTPFNQVALPMGWPKGMYEYRIRRTAAQHRQGKEYTWVGAYLFSHKSGREHPLGALRFEGSQLTMSRETTAYVDVADPDMTVDAVPRIRMTFWAWHLNGESEKPVTAMAWYPREAPPAVVSRPDRFRIVADIGVSADRDDLRELAQEPLGYLQTLFRRPVADEARLR